MSRVALCKEMDARREAQPVAKATGFTEPLRGLCLYLPWTEKGGQCFPATANYRASDLVLGRRAVLFARHQSPLRFH
jgi:hypothetical protein